MEQSTQRYFLIQPGKTLAGGGRELKVVKKEVLDNIEKGVQILGEAVAELVKAGVAGEFGVVSDLGPWLRTFNYFLKAGSIATKMYANHAKDLSRSDRAWLRGASMLANLGSGGISLSSILKGPGPMSTKDVFKLSKLLLNQVTSLTSGTLAIVDGRPAGPDPALVWGLRALLTMAVAVSP